jgi:hypothetical protein
MDSGASDTDTEVEELGESSSPVEDGEEEEEDPSEYCVGGYHPVRIDDRLDDRWVSSGPRVPVT